MDQKKIELDLPEQENEKLTYSTPVLKEFGEISSVVQSFGGVGADGAGGFPNDSAS